ncbi:MAG: hypothetical protein AAGC46_14680 [Solirubrobacteraceae bacterium]|nr:hypothetical protein [Patulibacter sp.]
MGFLRQMKDMKDMVNAAPGMIEQAQTLGAQAQEMAAAQQAAAQQQTAAAVAAANLGGAPGAAGAGQLAPIAGVSLEAYAKVSKGLAAYGYDQSKAPLVAEQHGISAADWDAAVAGWNARITADRSVGVAFNAAYQAA